MADTVWPSMMKTMPKDVADKLKGIWQEARGQGHDREIGHFALILALAVAAFQTGVPLIGAQRGP